MDVRLFEKRIFILHVERSGEFTDPVDRGGKVAALEDRSVVECLVFPEKLGLLEFPVHSEAVGVAVGVFVRSVDQIVGAEHKAD